MDQPRWPRGTPVEPSGHGPGGGRFRDGPGRTDWATRVAGIVGRITGTDRAAIARLSDMELDARAVESVRLAHSIPDTRSVHRPSPGGPWSPERVAMHERILRRVYDRYNTVPAGRRALMAGGLPGAGKTSTLRGQHLEQYMPVNPDEMKDEIIVEGGIPDLPEGAHALSPMEMSSAFYAESSYLADRLLEMALSDGRNVLIDATMGNREAPAARLARLREAGYSVRGVFVDVPVETSMRRAAARYRQDMREWAAGRGHGGRPIPLQFIEQSRGEPGGPTRNRQIFHDFIDQGVFDEGWEIHDNSGDTPRLVEEGK